MLARQLLPATPERGTTYQMMPLSRTPSSFSSRDPVYARFRAGLMGRHQATEVNVAQVRGWGSCHCLLVKQVKNLLNKSVVQSATQRDQPQ